MSDRKTVELIERELVNALSELTSSRVLASAIAAQIFRLIDAKIEQRLEEP